MTPPPKRLRPLRPSSDASTPSAASTPASSWSLPPARAQQRQTGYAAACETCRKRKKKCDRRRPACSSCTRRRLVCGYADAPLDPAQHQRLARAMHESGALAELIATLPYTDALELFHLLREAPKPELPGPESSPEVPRPPSQQSLLTSILPSSPNTLELELMVRHPIAYPFLNPIQATSLPVQRLLTPTRIQRPQLPLTPSSGDSLDTSARSSPELAQGDDEATIESDLAAIMAGLPPNRADLINQIDISRWTSLPIPNSVAIRVISLYVHNDYPVLPLFHVDLFLRDLVQAKPYFCSRFLVSALLSWGCQAYTALHPDAAPWSGAFFVEARDLWEQMSEKESVTLCNVTGLQLMSMTAVCHGRDLLACRYLHAGLQLAESMGLLNVPAGSASADAWLQGYDDWRRAASYTAWGVFNWACVFALHYHKAEVDIPPRLPLPGDIDAAIAAEHGTAASVGVDVEVFRAISKLWPIFALVTKAYYGEDSARQRPTLDFAEGIYRRLLAWADDLPLSLVRHQDSGHNVLMMHIYYHAIVTDVFRPFTLTSAQPLRTFGSPSASPKAVFRASVDQMKRLLLIYRLEFRVQMLSVIWQTCVIYVVNAAIREAGSNTDEVKFFLHLALAGLEDLYSCYRVFGPVAKGILGMAFHYGALGKKEVARISRELQTIGQRYTAADHLSKDPETASWIVDLDLAITDSVRAQGGKLAELFEKMDLKDSSESDT